MTYAKVFNFFEIFYFCSNIYKKVTCPIENIPDKYLTSNGDALSKLKTVYFKNDLLRCVVNDIDHDNFTCKVSLKWNDDSIKRDDNDKTKLVNIFFIVNFKSPIFISILF